MGSVLPTAHDTSVRELLENPYEALWLASVLAYSYAMCHPVRCPLKAPDIDVATVTRACDTTVLEGEEGKGTTLVACDGLYGIASERGQEGGGGGRGEVRACDRERERG